jgi:hypothetical protein
MTWNNLRAFSRELPFTNMLIRKTNTATMDSYPHFICKRLRFSDLFKRKRSLFDFFWLS